MTVPDQDRTASLHAASRPGPIRVLSRVLYAIGLFLLANLLFWICDGWFSGYPQAHSALLTILAMVAISVTGGVVWIVDERRSRDDD